MHESFLSYRKFLYLKVAALLCLTAILLFALHSPVDPPNGGTWLGYTLGTIGALLIIMLSWFGVRKRSYRSADRVAGWLSAHVYLGASLIVVVTLHCGFQFGLNVHTLAYVLTMLVIISGFYGLYAYRHYPRLMTANRTGVTREAMLAEVAEIDRESLHLADQINKEAHAVVLRSIEETVIGGSVIDQLFGDPARRAAGVSVSKGLEEVRKKVELRVATGMRELGNITDQEATAISFIAEQVSADTSGPEHLERIRKLLELIARRRALVERLQRDVQYHARLNAWLYLHVPLSMGLLAALLAHVISVFFYW